MRIRGIALDLDGTLFGHAAVRRHMAMRIAAFAALHPRQGCEAMRAIRAYREAQEQLRKSPGGNVASRQVELAAERAGQPAERVAATVRRWMEEAPLAAVRRARFPGVMEFFQWARSAGLPLAVVSDYPARKKLDALELAPYITAIVTAQDADVDSFKPNPAGLLKALALMAVEPHQAVFVGDRMEVDMAAAAAGGVPGVLLGNCSAAPAGFTSLPTWPAVRAWVAART